MVWSYVANFVYLYTHTVKHRSKIKKQLTAYKKSMHIYPLHGLFGLRFRICKLNIVVITEMAGILPVIVSLDLDLPNSRCLIDNTVTQSRQSYRSSFPAKSLIRFLCNVIIFRFSSGACTFCSSSGMWKNKLINHVCFFLISIQNVVLTSKFQIMFVNIM